MSDPVQDEYLARIAADILFSDKYGEVIAEIYKNEGSVADFEADPKPYLLRHGIAVPDGLDVIIHDAGEVGKPARVDFHWGDWAKASLNGESARSRELRRLARQAWDTLQGPEIQRLRQVLRTSPDVLREFAANPREYARLNGIPIGEEFEVFVHAENSEDPRIDLHFHVNNDQGSQDTRSPRGSLPTVDGGCCYCGNGGCCYYALA